MATVNVISRAFRNGAWLVVATVDGVRATFHASNLADLRARVLRYVAVRDNPPPLGEREVVEATPAPPRQPTQAELDGRAFSLLLREYKRLRVGLELGIAGVTQAMLDAKTTEIRATWRVAYAPMLENIG